MNEITGKEFIEYKQSYLINKDAVIKTIITHISQNGMSRHITPLWANEHGDIINLSHIMSDILGWRLNKQGSAVVVGGCGMDMGFHLVYSFSRAWFAKDGKQGDVGYWLKQEWL